MILVDSSVWIDFFLGRDTAQAVKLDRFMGIRPLAIGDLILTEVLQGVRNERDFNRVRRTLDTFTQVDLAGKDIAIQAARNFRILRGLGITVRKTIDTIIATRCIESRLTLLHADRDFDGFAEHLGLMVI